MVKVLRASSQPKMQQHLKSCHLVPMYLGSSFAVHVISMPIVMVQPCPSPNLNKLPLLERGNQI